MKKVKVTKIPAIWEPENSRCALKLPKPAKLFPSPPKLRQGQMKHIVDAGGQLHCTNGPAVEFQDGSFQWWRSGQAHRDGDLPAVHVGTSYQLSVDFHSGWKKAGFAGLNDFMPDTDLWCIDGFLHRDGKPAIITKLKTGGLFEEYWCNGRRHNSAGPASTGPTSESWFYHGLRHREHGPAYVHRTDGATDERWFWYGDLLMKDSKIQPDFPFAAPPPTYLLTALSSSDFSTELVASALSLISKNVSALMPDFNLHMSSCHDDLTWEITRAHIKATLSPREVEESCPLPDGLFDEV